MFSDAFKQYLGGERTRQKNRLRRVATYKFDWLNKNKDPADWKSVTPLPSRIAVIGEDGVGDEIFYLRFARALARQCEDVIWVHNGKDEVSQDDNSKLLPLSQNSFRDCRKLSFGAFEDYSFGKGPVIFSKELIKYYGAEEKDWLQNTQIPYITALSELTQALRRRYSKGDRLVVGLAWNSEGGKPGKSCPLNSPGWKSIFEKGIRDQCSFVSLQYGNTEDEIHSALLQYQVDIFNDREIDNFNKMEQAAAQTAACDLIISISTSAAHLAGALGKATLLLLPADPIVHWEFPGAYPTIERFENLSLEDAGRRLPAHIGHLRAV